MTLWPLTLWSTIVTTPWRHDIMTPMPKETTGPRGGKTTMTETGLVRKTIWLHTEEAEELRRHSYEERRSESELVREAVRQFFKIPD
jgi:hypothetical protein